jgi:hypothetical protein
MLLLLKTFMLLEPVSTVLGIDIINEGADSASVEMTRVLQKKLLWKDSQSLNLVNC